MKALNKFKPFFKKIFINKNLFFLWLGQVISQAGDSIYEIGLLWLMLEISGSKTATGLVAMSGYLPTLLFGMYSGALVDRFERRRLMMIADLMRGGLVLLIPLLYYMDGLNGLVLGLFTFALAMFNSLFNPARDAIITELAEGAKLLQANALNQTSWQFALLLGPGLAGLIIPLVGTVHLFNVDALTFFVSFWFISRIARAKKNPQTAETRDSFSTLVKRSIGDVKLGLLFARRDKRIWAILMITAIDNLFIMGPAIVGAPIFVREILHESADIYAFTQVAYAVGMLLGTVFVNFLGKRFPKGKILLWGIVFDGLTFFPLLWVETFPQMFLTLVVHSFVIPMIIIPRPTMIQEIVPREFQGRIFSMISVSVVGFTAISMALTGIAAEFIPINQVYAIIAIAAALCGVVGWFIRDFRETA